MSDRKTLIAPGAPRAIGPYSHAVVTGNLAFAAGQTGINPETDNMVEGIAGQTRQALRNLDAIFQAVGTSLQHALKTTVYLADMGDFQAMNAVYAEFFPSDPPARTTIQVARLPLDALVEIEAVAVLG